MAAKVHNFVRRTTIEGKVGDIGEAEKAVHRAKIGLGEPRKMV